MQKTEALIIGSGAGAAPIAFRLAQQGIKVTVLEKGDWCKNDPLNEDELAQIHLEMYRPSAELDPTVVYSQSKTVTEASRVGQSFYLVGGGTLRYAGTSWRFRKEDFRKRSTYGSIANTSLADWPLSYEELEPFYSEAEKEIGISGLSGADPTEPYRSVNNLMPPLDGDKFQKRLMAAAKKLGWHPFPIPLAIHSKLNQTTGGSQCMQCGWCSGFPCRFWAKSSVDVMVYPRAQETGHFTLKPKSYATRIITNGDARVKGVEYINLETNKTEFIACDVLIVASSAIQTSRLLLVSANKQFPNGLANSSGELGHNLMFHIEAKASAVFDDEYHQGLYKKVGVHDFYFPEKSDAFINHRSLQSGSKATPIGYALSQKGIGTDFIKNMQQNFLRTQELQCMTEDLPQNQNHVTLSATKKDLWGIAAPEVHHVYHEMDRAATAASLLRATQLLEASGGKDIQIPKIHDNITGRYTWHLMGTARMGNDPKTSVVNKNCQSHDIPNLFVLDGSSFVTSAGLNPTLTIQALSFRTASILKQEINKL